MHGADMTTYKPFGILASHWEAERAQAEEELLQLERERALEDIARLVRRFDLTLSEVRSIVGGAWAEAEPPVIRPFEPYFGGR